MSAPEGDQAGRPPPVLVIGVGSELRRDDAVGRHVAARVEAVGLPGVEVRQVHQLTPELALDLVDRRLVVVVDAAVGAVDVEVRPVTAAAGADPLTHHLDVPSLLAVAALLGRPPGQVLLVGLPVADLGLGETLSDVGARMVARATAQVLVLSTAAARQPEGDAAVHRAPTVGVASGTPAAAWQDASTSTAAGGRRREVRQETAT